MESGVTVAFGNGKVEQREWLQDIIADKIGTEMICSEQVQTSDGELVDKWWVNSQGWEWKYKFPTSALEAVLTKKGHIAMGGDSDDIVLLRMEGDVEMKIDPHGYGHSYTRDVKQLRISDLKAKNPKRK